MARKRADFGQGYANAGAYLAGGGSAFVEQTQSIDFSVGDQFFLSNTAAALGLTKVFSVALWSRIPTVGGVLPLLAWRRTSGTNDSFIWKSHDTGKNFQFFINDADDAADQNLIWGNPAGWWDDWRHTVFTWDGTVSGTKLYIDGVDDDAANTTNVNLDGDDITDSDRKIYVGSDNTGAFWDGRMFSLAIYNTVITQAEAAAMYNSGDGAAFDLENDSGNYASSASMQHYYRLGFGSDHTDWGEDRGNAAVQHDMENSSIDGDYTVDDVPDGLQA